MKPRQVWDTHKVRVKAEETEVFAMLAETMGLTVGQFLRFTAQQYAMEALRDAQKGRR